MGKNSKLLFIYKSVLIIIFVCALFTLFLSKTKEKDSSSFLVSSNHIQKEDLKNSVQIPLRSLEELSGLKKEEIYKKRIAYVKSSSVLKDLKGEELKNYTPNNNVYNFEDNLSWIGLEQIVKYGMKDNKNIGKGTSRSSLAINNPELLVSFIAPDYSLQKDKKGFSCADYLLPNKLLWDRETKTIRAYFNITDFFKNNPTLIGSAMFIDETNARDLGYEWMLAQKQENIRFQNPQKNMRIRPYKPQGRYQKGTSCAIKEGCNNYSPYQEELVFGIIDLPSSIQIKFWNKKPETNHKKADVTYIMIFE